LQQQLVTRSGSAVAGPAPASIGGRSVTWVEPAVVVEVQFTERTNDGKLRHPVFLRVRTDKSVSEAGGE
jgi:bifunctional non-homologous end joining protein LigD